MTLTRGNFFFCVLSLMLALLTACGSEPTKQSGLEAASDAAGNATPLETSVYRLGAGDKVSIVVFGERELSLDVILNDTGTFTYPYLGQLTILDKTLPEVETMITEGLSKGYLVDPKVSVTMDSFREVYVGGEVTQGGNFTYQPGLTVGKAIVLAGGFTERASRSRIYVVSEGSESAKPKRVSLDYVLKPGDVITVQRRFF